MTVLEYLDQPGRLRFVVASPAAPDKGEGLTAALLLSAHQTLEAAKEALRWERQREKHDPAVRTARGELLVVDLESLETR